MALSETPPEYEGLFNSEQEALEAIYVTNVRILDTLYTIGLYSGEARRESVRKLIDMHAEGGFVSPITSLDFSKTL